jgi:DNA-binding transcriptional ArsR family regulator
MADDTCELLCLDLPTAERIRACRLSEATATEISGLAHALSDPTRLTLGFALREADELCVCDLAWIVGRSQNLVSHHVRTLRAHGLVRSRPDGKMVMYSLTEKGHRLLAAIVEEQTVAA